MRQIVQDNVGRLVATVLAAGCLLATTASAANAQSEPEKSLRPAIGGSFHWIRNSGNSGLCLEPAGLSTDSSALIVQEPCVSSGVESLAQGWQGLQVGNNHFKFQNQLSGLCLNATDIINGSIVNQWPCNSNSNEEFNLGTSLPAVAKIESRIHFRDTGFCVDEPGALGTVGAAMQIWQCNGTPAQIWVNGF